MAGLGKNFLWPVAECAANADYRDGADQDLRQGFILPDAHDPNALAAGKPFHLFQRENQQAIVAGERRQAGLCGGGRSRRGDGDGNGRQDAGVLFHGKKGLACFLA